MAKADKATAVADIAEQFKEATATLVTEYRVRAEDGAHRWFRMRSVPIRSESGRIVKWYVTATDVDDLKAFIN